MAETNREDFFRTKPVDQTLYTTLEFYNAAAGLRRYVSKQQQDLTLTIESGAPRNAGESVAFSASAFNAPEPEQGDDGGISLNISLSHIGTEIKDYLRDVESAWPPTIEVVYRQYLSGVTNPVFTLYLQAESPELGVSDLSVRASQVNPESRGVAVIMREDKYPGMQGVI